MKLQTKQKAKRVIAAVAGLFSGFRGRRSVILNYHSIHPFNEFSTTPADFERQMSYVKEHFDVMSFGRFVQARLDDQKRDILAITFDDGYEDNYSHAFPVLQKLGLPAAIFLTSGFLDGEVDIAAEHIHYRGLKSLTWAQVREMLKHGIEFGSHTHTHPILTRIPIEQAEYELVGSRRRIAEETSSQVESFAYPLGQPNTFNESIVRKLKDNGYKYACTAIFGSANYKTDSFHLKRIRIDSCDSFDDFVSKTKGNWDFVGCFQKLKG